MGSFGLKLCLGVEEIGKAEDRVVELTTGICLKTTFVQLSLPDIYAPLSRCLISLPFCHFSLYPPTFSWHGITSFDLWHM